MAHQAVDYLRGLGLPGEFIVFLVSMTPILELRGGLVAGAVLGVPVLAAAVIAFIGNALPIPFIILFIRYVFELLRRFEFWDRIISAIEESAMKRSETIAKREALGLFLFVGIPLPGTGGWTGALCSVLLGVPPLKSFLAIMGGILLADIIMVVVSYVIPGLIF